LAILSTLKHVLCLQNLGLGILVAPLIGFLESIAIAKAFGEFTSVYVGELYTFTTVNYPQPWFIKCLTVVSLPGDFVMTPYWVLIQWTALLILSYVPLSVHSSVLANTAFNATDSVW